MTAVTIITIVAIAFLTAIIVLLARLGYVCCIKAYKTEIAQGRHDAEICEKYYPKKKRSKGEIAGSIVSGVMLAFFVSLFSVGLVYRLKGDGLVFNGQAALVIKSRSMSGFYDEALAEEYRTYNYDAGLQFGVGDICFFKTVSADDALVKGDVYGYKRNNIIITHRLTAEYEGGLYEFKGDNNPIADMVLIPRDRIIYHYTGNKIPYVGAFVLYAQSYLGLWSLAGVMTITIASTAVDHSISTIEKKRYERLQLGRIEHEE